MRRFVGLVLLLFSGCQSRPEERTTIGTARVPHQSIGRTLPAQPVAPGRYRARLWIRTNPVVEQHATVYLEERPHEIPWIIGLDSSVHMTKPRARALTASMETVVVEISLVGDPAQPLITAVDELN